VLLGGFAVLAIVGYWMRRFEAIRGIEHPEEGMAAAGEDGTAGARAR
jgi:hypothetical protein